jgi:hypothetical protein
MKKFCAVGELEKAIPFFFVDIFKLTAQPETGLTLCFIA